jgi:class 3 adenylate cyclase/tetratricopeptide (TPR) repeat protein
VICTACGQENPATSRFCASCGAALTSAGPEVRKTVTVFFCDLVGSTALGDRTDPEVLRQVMARYHAELRTVLERHGGTVEKFVGDAAMAVFGLPQVHEDDAIRAVRAGVEIRDVVASQGLEVRIGISTGEVVAASGETLVTGDAVNVAARLEQSATPGEILIGLATQRLVRELVEAEAVDPLSLKGKSEPVPAFRVVGLVEPVPAFTRHIDAPFIGRGAELAHLEAAMAATVEARRPHLATIVGPPGIGKSRLVRELLARVEARVLVGRCLSYGEGITYWPLREITSQVGGIEAALAGQADGELAAERIAAATGGSSTPASPEEIAWGFRRLLETVAMDGPVLVVFDDIHWAEPVLLDLIEYVVAFAKDVPLFVLCTARPDLFEERPSWTAPKPNTSILNLEPLSDIDSGGLVERLADLPAEAVGRVVQAAEGNPLFVEQLVSMWAESDDGELEVPPTLQALLAARIDRLTGGERAVMSRGSVEGRLFHRGAVTALLAETERGEVGAHLMTLVRKELIRPDRAVVAGDDGFRFAHILIRDAAYDAIPKRVRASLHESYAAWLMSRMGDEAPNEIVGYHLEQAYRYGAELGAPDAALGARGAARLAAAARAAGARSDVAAEVNFYGRAVELVPDGVEQPGLLVRLGLALHQGGELEQAELVLQRALAMGRTAGDAHVEWMARVELAYVRTDRMPEGGAELAMREGEAAIAAREPAQDHEVLARAWRLISESHNYAGRFAEDQAALDLAMVHAAQAGDVALEARIATRYGPIFIFGPAPVEEGLRYVDDLTERLGHIPAVREFGLHVIAHLRARLGDFETALDAIRGYREPMRERGQDRFYALTSNCVWDVCLWAGTWEPGEAAVREGYEMSIRMGNVVIQSTTALDLAESLFRQGRIDETAGFVEIGEQLSASDDVFNQVKILVLKAGLSMARGDLTDAEVIARKSVAAASATDFLDLAAGAWLNLAAVLRAAGNTEAGAAASEAHKLFRQKGNLVGAKRARAFLEAAPAGGGGS